MKKFTVVLVFSILVYSACQSAPGNYAKAAEAVNPIAYVPSVPDAESQYPPEPMGLKPAFDYFRDEGLTVGWNLGNTLDSWAIGASGEDVFWGNPKANQEIFNGVKAAGFNVIRIPITWFGHMGPAPDYHIDEAFLGRVAEVVGYARSAGFKAVIINLHHDGSTDRKNGITRDYGWLALNTARRDAQGYNEVSFEFGRVWKQIAQYFAGYGDWLIFESFNELHDGGWGWSPEAQQRPQYDIINKFNQLFTDVVRSSGSNNADRYLISVGYSAAFKHTLSDYFTMPADTAPNSRIVAFHCYDPYEFGILGSRPNWGSDADKIKTDRDFAPFKAAFTDKSIPVILGECGAVRQLYPDDKTKEAEARQNRLNYISHVFATARKYGIIPVYWDNGDFSSANGEKFSLFNRATGKPNSDESAAVILAIMNAVK